ncbi:Na+/H+ antiporter NhaA [Pengzhenrongella sp.]|uniref:Na+/H+ antiporter NhaA n=1 Tax=Pengzhenrongella sp. TaxID=2888820 RepID=UPI0039C94757
MTASPGGARADRPASALGAAHVSAPARRRRGPAGLAIIYTVHLAVLPLLAALAPLTLSTVVVQRRVRSWWVLPPLAVIVWSLGIHRGSMPTIAGVLLGFGSLSCAATGCGLEAGPGLAE